MVRCEDWERRGVASGFCFMMTREADMEGEEEELRGDLPRTKLGGVVALFEPGKGCLWGFEGVCSVC
jgi:hypothetical protein